MSDKDWLGYTPMTPEIRAHLRRLWREHDLPEADFDEMSVELAREVYEIVTAFTKPEAGVDRDDLLLMLDAMGTWSEDPIERHWAPV